MKSVLQAVYNNFLQPLLFQTVHIAHHCCIHIQEVQTPYLYYQYLILSYRFLLICYLCLSFYQSLYLQIFFDLCCRDLRCPFQIYNFAIVFQKVKLSFPVIPHYKGIYLKFFDIRNLLFPVLLRND